MIIREVGSRGVIFTFDDNISVYLIKGDHYSILCDTHLGPLSMDVIKEYLSTHSPNKEILIFNSHSDWDHIWGNCAFPKSKVIAHDKAKTRMLEIGEYELHRLSQLHRGKIELKLPNLTFSEKLTLPDEEMEFIYAPGHTIDSSLCFDQRDSVLFVGDLVESPIPYLDYYNLDTFIQTLEFIKNFPSKIKLSAHSGIISSELIEQNISYIKGILQGESIEPNLIGFSVEVHQYNVNNRLLLMHEPLIRKKLDQKFNYSAYKASFKDLGKMNTEDFKESLNKYLNGIGLST